MEQGTDAIVAVGTTGRVGYSRRIGALRAESVRWSSRSLVESRVIAGTGANSTREAISLTRCAKQAGADACLLVTPYYNKPTQEGLYLHHKAVAEGGGDPADPL